MPRDPPTTSAAFELREDDAFMNEVPVENDELDLSWDHIRSSNILSAASVKPKVKSHRSSTDRQLRGLCCINLGSLEKATI